MLKWWSDSWYWFYLTLFKTNTLESKSKKILSSQAMMIFFKFYLFFSIFFILLIILSGIFNNLLGNFFYWKLSFKIAFISIIAGSVGGIYCLRYELSSGLILGLSFILGFEFISGVIIGLKGSNGFGIDLGLSGGIIFGIIFSLTTPKDKFLFLGLVFGLTAGFFGKESESINYVLWYLLSLTSTFLILYLRPFYLPIHLVQYWYSKKSQNPYKIFRYSPIHWDEMIHLPLPYMYAWLVHLARYDQAQGIAAIEFIANERPVERKTAFKALVIILGDDLAHANTLPDLFKLKEFFKRFPNEDKALPIGLNEARQHFNRISELAQDYLNRQTFTGQQQVLKELHTQMHEFHDLMKLTPAPVGTAFQPHAARWLQMLAAEQTKLQAQAQFNPLPNPYIAGNPLQARDQHLFVGRRDLLLALEELILNTQQKPSLLLYGRRRTGKSSTLLNLPQSRFESVYIDCQDSRWHESDQAFCYNLAKAVFEALFKSGSLAGLNQPKLEQYEKNAFTQLDAFLEPAQKLAEQRSKRILLAFDEYEALEDAVLNQYISERVLGKLRNLIQHHPMIVVLVSGGHRFEELPRINWANYLINTHLLELSFLAPSAAHELLTQPVPELSYAEGVVEAIIQATHCQPYLLQAVASELVNYLNSQKRSLASLDDVELAFSKTLKKAAAYFTDTWRKDNSPEEQVILRAFAQGTHLSETNAALLQGLIRKELVEQVDDTYQLAVPLFARWIRENQ